MITDEELLPGRVRVTCSERCHDWDMPDGWRVTLVSMVDPHGVEIIRYPPDEPLTIDTSHPFVVAPDPSVIHTLD